MRRLVALALVSTLAACDGGVSAETKAKAIDAFATVEKVMQHPRCANCHIPGDQPLQYDTQTPHTMQVVRGPDGHGSPTLQCGTCHGEANLAASYGAHAPPGAPNWALPPPAHKMAWMGLPASQLCTMLKDKTSNGNRDFAALVDHVAHDKLVLWGWSPGGERSSVSVPHEQFVAAFKTWADAGGPCP